MFWFVCIRWKSMKGKLKHLMITSADNKTDIYPSTFILIGIPGLETAHIWISIPFCVIYLLALLGNCSLLFIIKTDSSLHEPMYLFLCMLALADLTVCTTAVPKFSASSGSMMERFVLKPASPKCYWFTLAPPWSLASSWPWLLTSM